MWASTTMPGAEATDEREGLLRVRLLGGLDVRARDGHAVPVESGRLRSLLGLLAMQPGVLHPRQHVAFLLWPDSTESQARTNLRKLLHLLRRDAPDLDPYVEVTPLSVSWRLDPPSWIDVVAFEAHLANAHASDGVSDEAVRSLRAAVELYEGDLLEGFDDEWAVEARERLADGYTAALRQLVDGLVERGEPADAIEFGRRLLRVDPLREHSCRLLMGAHAAAGDRAAAVRVYHECVSTLQRELGVEPAAETSSLYAALAQPAADAGGAAAETVSRPGRLVGRDAEWRELARWWLTAEAGRSALVLVTGEPGVGKTRLVEELSTWCAHRGGVVAVGHAYAAGGGLAYGVAASWLRSEALAGAVSRAGASAAGDLALLLPELGPPPSARDDAAVARQRLCDAVVRLVRATDRPLLLVADDAHWCDAPTLQLAHDVLRRDPTLPLLVVATVRREELDVDHSLGEVAADLARLDRAGEVALGRLSRGETEVLARDLSAGDIDLARVDALHAESEGNPLFVVELLRAVGAGSHASPAALPRKLQVLTESRLRRLSRSARDIAGLAAAVGRSFSTELLRLASGMTDEALASALDELWRRGVIREQPGDTYDFTHGKVREVAYGMLAPAASRRHHAVLADVLQRLHPAGHEAVAAQIAAHHERAAQASEAITWYVRAARWSQRMYADAEAVRFLEQARVLTEALPAAERPRRELDVLTAMPAALVAVDGFASSRLTATQQRALDLAAWLGVEPDPVLLRSLVMSRLCARDLDAAGDAAVRLLGAAESAGDDVLAVEADYLLGISAFWAGRLHDARDRFVRVVDRFDSSRRDEHLVRFGHDPSIVCLSRLANTLFFLGDDAAARRARDHAVDLADRVAHPYSCGAAYGFGILVSVDLGEIDVVRDFLRAVSSREDVWGPIAVLLEVARGYLAVLDGDVDGGLPRMTDAIGATGDVDTAPGLLAGLRRLLVAAVEATGNPAIGLAVADDALAATGSRLWEAEIRRVRAELLVVGGHPPAVVAAELSAATAVADRQGAVGLGRRVAASRSRLGIA